MKVLKDVKLNDKIDFSEVEDFNDIFFDHFFPSVAGHGEIIDEFHSNVMSTYHSTYQEVGAFYDEDADDPDWIVKLCYTLLVAAATESVVGLENLFKSGKSGGRHDYPNFGQYITRNKFKCFMAAAPYCWTDKKNWYLANNEKTWDIFHPILDSYNGKRKHLLETVLILMLDESMSGWRPKTSKLGGLPNITWEPRKPISLGTMFKNGAECKTGIILFQDVVAAPDCQMRKKFYDEDSSLPGTPPVPQHTAEVLRQVEGAKVIEGGWVGGDAWFGSVITAVEVYKRLGVYRYIHKLLIVRLLLLYCCSHKSIFFRWMQYFHC
jgi:hypothetical protein